MTEVLRDNFEKLYPKIEKDLKQAAVVSVDTEFSGLLSSDDFKSRYVEVKHVKEALFSSCTVVLNDFWFLFIACLILHTIVI